MASSLKPGPKHKPPFPQDIDADERRGLLRDSNDDVDTFYESDTKSEGWSQKKMAITALAFILLLITGTFMRTVLWAKADHRDAAISNNGLLSNGTDQFKPTVLIVSIDGLRYTNNFNQLGP